MPTATELAYIAGFIDADGWITLHANQFGNVSFSVGIVNRDSAVLLWVESLFGGRYRAKSRPKEDRNWSPTGEWHVKSASAEPFLRAILPYLRVKKEQAELVLEFLASRQSGWRRGGLQPDIRKRREEMYHRVRFLNRRGINHGIARLKSCSFGAGMTSPFA